MSPQGLARWIVTRESETMSVHLRFLGAAGCVTGSCALLQTRAASILIDCGLFQGQDALEARNDRDFSFDAAGIDAVLLTHAHIDHSGLLPKLMLAGFRGRVLATEGTIDLCRILLPDAGAIQEMEAGGHDRGARNEGRKAAPAYTKADAEACMDLFRAVALDAWVDVAPGVRARWWNAGHILGAASIEVEIREGGQAQTLLISGDLGPGGRWMESDPEGPSGVDHLILESTYGDTERPFMDDAGRKRALAQEVRAAHAAGGPLLIPAFAVERAQELIVDLLDLIEAGDAPPGMIFLDSPLAIRACDVFLRHRGDGEPGGRLSKLRESARLRFTERMEESRVIDEAGDWHVVIAGSGMCEGGRVSRHLKRLLWRVQATVLLAGFQASGTLGRALHEGRRVVRIGGEEIMVEARVRMLDVYSAHADAAGLVTWAKARAPVRGSVFLVHGEPESLKGLQGRLCRAGIADGRVSIAAPDRIYRIMGAAGVHGSEAKGQPGSP
jgi:metallo-beta-lactamase family protein